MLLRCSLKFRLLKHTFRQFPSSPVFPTVFTKELITSCWVIKPFALENTPYMGQNYISQHEPRGPAKNLHIWISGTRSLQKLLHLPFFCSSSMFTQQKCWTCLRIQVIDYSSNCSNNLHLIVQEEISHFVKQLVKELIPKFLKVHLMKFNILYIYIIYIILYYTYIIRFGQVKMVRCKFNFIK